MDEMFSHQECCQSFLSRVNVRGEFPCVVRQAAADGRPHLCWWICCVFVGFFYFLEENCKISVYTYLYLDFSQLFLD